jgi:hypothetical protein
MSFIDSDSIFGWFFLVVFLHASLRGWTHILDHLLAALAKHSLNLARIPGAIGYYVELLGNQVTADGFTHSLGCRVAWEPGDGRWFHS